jgi:cell division septation protein DedD
MSDIYSDDYRSVRDADAGPLLPPTLSRVPAAALFLALVAGMAVWAYRLGTRDASQVPIIRAQEGPARVEPEDPGGLQAAHQGLEVNTVLGGAPAPSPADAAPVVVPPPVALREEDGPQGELVIPVPEFSVAAEPGEGEELRMPVQDDGPLADGGAAGTSPPAASEPIGERTVADLLALALAEDAAEAALAEDGAAEEVAALPGPRPLGRPAGHVVRRPAPAPVAQEAVRAPSPAAPAASSPTPSAAPREVASVAPGTRLVQLGAFDNEELARQVWGQLAGRHGDLLGAKSLFLERATHNARVFYRLRVAGFQTADETRVLCESLRARGVDCIPVTLQ